MARTSGDKPQVSPYIADMQREVAKFHEAVNEFCDRMTPELAVTRRAHLHAVPQEESLPSGNGEDGESDDGEDLADSVMRSVDRVCARVDALYARHSGNRLRVVE